MNDAATEIRNASERAARTRLRQAASFAALHSSSKPLFQKLMRRPGSTPVLIRFDWPGVLSVFDPATGDLLARSISGQPTHLDVPTPSNISESLT